MTTRGVFFASLCLRGEKFPLIFSLASFDTNHCILIYPDHSIIKEKHWEEKIDFLFAVIQENHMLYEIGCSKEPKTLLINNCNKFRSSIGHKSL